MREVVPTVEQAGIDEGYLDLGEIAPAFDDARALAESVQAVIRARTQLSCSLGLASSKVVAKIASDRRKPGGLTIVRPGREAAFLAPLAIRLLPGIGPRAEARLVAGGIETIGDLAALGDDELRALLPGKVGRMVRDRARGDRPAAARGLGRAHLDLARGDFPRDVGDPERLHDELTRMADRLAEHLRDRGQTGAHRHDEAALSRLRDPHALDLAAGRHRRRRAHRRARVRAARPRAARPARAAAARRRRRLRPRRARPARALADGEPLMDRNDWTRGRARGHRPDEPAAAGEARRGARPARARARARA